MGIAVDDIEIWRDHITQQQFPLGFETFGQLLDYISGCMYYRELIENGIFSVHGVAAVWELLKADKLTDSEVRNLVELARFTGVHHEEAV